MRAKLSSINGHNLCLKCPNGSWEPISNIYVSRDFQWYKELFNPMGFAPTIPIWIFRNPSGFQFPKCRELAWECGGVIPSHSPTFPRTWNVTPNLHTWPTPLQALALVASPRLGLQQQVLMIINLPKISNKLLYKACKWIKWIEKKLQKPQITKFAHEDPRAQILLLMLLNLVWLKSQIEFSMNQICT